MVIGLIIRAFSRKNIIIIVQLMMNANSRIRYGLQIVFVCLYITLSHYHHCANLSVDTELMKCLPDIFCRVCEWDVAYSLSYPLFNIWDCMFSVCPIPSWWLREYIALSYYHHQIGGMNYYPLFRVMSWNNGMRCMSLYILFNMLTKLSAGEMHICPISSPSLSLLYILSGMIVSVYIIHLYVRTCLVRCITWVP